MKINKRCLSAFSKTKPLLALGTKSKLFDTTFSLTSELSLYNYSEDTHYPTLQLDRKFSKLLWCEKNDKSILATGHDQGVVSLYETEDTLRLLNTFDGMEKEVLGLDYNVSKNVLAAGSSEGKIIFWNLDKIDQQYKCEIPIKGNITALSWNRKVSRILAAGTDDGRILVLDIRAKSIAMSLETPGGKGVTQVAWHPTCPTSLFSSSSSLHSFNLSTDSVVDIQKDVVGFDILDDSTLVAYSRSRIDYIDVETQKTKESEEGHLIYDASFSSRDPLACLSSSDGFTTVSGRRESSLRPSHSQAILVDYVVGNEPLKISYQPLSPSHSEDLSHRVLKEIYEDGRFNLNDTTRKEVGKLILEEEKENEFLKDPVVLALISGEYETIPSSSTVSLRFVVDLLQKRTTNLSTTTPVELLLFLMASGRYEEVVDHPQWRIMVSLILLSAYPLDKAMDLFKGISSRVEDKGLLYLLMGNPGEYLSLSNSSPPSSVFDLQDFFLGFLPEVEKVKALRIDSENKYLEEFMWYAQTRGLNELVKDLKIKPKGCTGTTGSSVEKKIERHSLNPPVHERKMEVPPTPFNKSVPSTSFNNSISSSTPYNKSVPSTPFNNNVPSTPFNKTVPSTPFNKSVSPSPGFSTRPPVRPPLYSCSSSGSTPNFLQKPRQENVPGTYGSEDKHPKIQASNSIPTIPTRPNIPARPSIPTIPTSTHSSPPLPGSKVIPPFKPTVPSPDMTRNSSPPSDYNPEELSEELVKVYEMLKGEASKKNNLIIGNKIKDATRRFSIFLNLDKHSLSKNVLYRISLMVQSFKDIPQKDLLKQSVRTIVEESIELQENQCNIWIPAIYTLVQLVY